MCLLGFQTSEGCGPLRLVVSFIFHQALLLLHAAKPYRCVNFSNQYFRIWTPCTTSILKRLQYSRGIGQVVLLCFGYLPSLPVALKHHDNEMFVDSRITAVEKSVTEIQCTERKLHLSVEKVEAQIQSFQKSVESFLPRFDTMASESPNTSPQRHKCHLLCYDFYYQ